MLYSLDNLEDPANVSLKRLEEVSDYSYQQRNGGRVLKIGSFFFRVRQLSDEKRYGIALAIDSIVSKQSKFEPQQLFENCASRQISLDDIRFEGLADKEFVGTHTYDADERIEVLDIAWMQYSIVEYIGTIWEWLIQGIKKRMFGTSKQ